MAKIGQEDYKLFSRFQAAVAKIRAEEHKNPEQQNEVKLANYRRQAAAVADKLYRRHSGLVYATVKQYLGHLTSARTARQENSSQVNVSLGWSDLVQEGCIGLLTAFEDFVPRAGYRFSTYAQNWIYQAITRPVMMSVEVPAYLILTLKRLKQAKEKLAKTLNRLPTEEELAKETGLSYQKLSLTLQAERRAVGRVSLDALNGCGPLLSAANQPDTAAEVDRKNLKSVLPQAFEAAGLDKRHQMIVAAYFGLNGAQPQTQAEIGRQLNLTRERIRQLLDKALKKLVSGKARKLLEPYQYLIA